MTKPSIYVGTYAAYNNGSLKGRWFDLEDYADRNEFYEAIQAFHSDPANDDSRTEPEDDPEFMFQDWEDIPAAYIGESWLDPDVWDKWVNLDDDERELLKTYLEEVYQSGDLEVAQDAYHGKFDSELDFAYAYWEESGMLVEIPSHLQNYIDYDAWLNDMKCSGAFEFVRNDGDVWVFRGD